MTKFEPEVAYRILNDRYERLILEKSQAMVQFFEAAMNGHWYNDVFYSLDRVVKSYEEDLDRLWPVRDYLRTRIEEEKHDTV